MLVNYFVPLGILAGTYTRVGCELWGSQFIGEYNKQQAESVRSKRRVGLLNFMDIVFGQGATLDKVIPFIFCVSLFLPTSFCTDFQKKIYCVSL